MTVEEFLRDKVNAQIAKLIWGKLSTELEQKIYDPSGAYSDERKLFQWLVDRAKELLDEYNVADKKTRKAPQKETIEPTSYSEPAKRIKDEKEAEN